MPQVATIDSRKSTHREGFRPRAEEKESWEVCFSCLEREKANDTFELRLRMPKKVLDWQKAQTCECPNASVLGRMPVPGRLGPPIQSQLRQDLRSSPSTVCHSISSLADRRDCPRCFAAQWAPIGNWAIHSLM